METTGFSFKDFEKVHIKSTYNIEIGNRRISEGETIAYFDKIQIFGLNEVAEHVSARGGYHNREHVFWNIVQEMPLQFAQGVFSQQQLALLMNCHLLQPQTLLDPISEYEVLEVNESLRIMLSRENVKTDSLYIYNKGTGELLSGYTVNVTQAGKYVITFTNISPFTEVICIYEWIYGGSSTILKVGEELLKGYVSLEGRTRIKDDTEGTVTTGIIKIPKLKLMSDVSIRLGANASPLVANFKGTAFPVGPRGNSKVLEFYCLDTYLDGDI